MTGRVVYPGRDLEAMSFAANYHRWVLDVLAPDLGERLVEVGAGRGDFSALLAARGPRALALVEPSVEMYGALRERFTRDRAAAQTSVRTYHALFRDVADELRRDFQPDSIIYVNVLEHVADDAAELRAVRHALARGGRLHLFVPALPQLYGNFDREVGHFRRYLKRELAEKCRAAGFEVLRASYFDLLGVVPWWVKYRLLGASTLDARSVRLYDRYGVPLARALESLLSPPVGKNLILVARKK